MPINRCNQLFISTIHPNKKNKVNIMFYAFLNRYEGMAMQKCNNKSHSRLDVYFINKIVYWWKWIKPL